MPYAWIQRPSAALGLLQAFLEQAGIQTESLYANLLFAETSGLHDYAHITGSLPYDAVGDWTFSHIAFPESHSDPEKFVDLLRKRRVAYAKRDRNQLMDLLLRVRDFANSFTDRLARHIVELGAPIVGCSSTFSQHVPSLAILRRIRDLAPEVITLMGGANCETVMGKTTHELFQWVDYVVSGEADDLIARLVRDLLQGGRDLTAQSLPTGVFGPVHRKEGYPQVESTGPDNTPRATSGSLDLRPIPNYDAYFNTLQASSLLKDPVSPGIPLETSRGCWWGEKQRCTFCGLNGRDHRYRVRPIDEILCEMRILHERHEVNRIEVVDNVLDMNHFQRLLPQLKHMGARYKIFFETRSNLTRDHVKALSEAGVNWIQPGIESLDSRALKAIHKGTRSWQNVQLLKWCHEYGVRCNWFILHDFPGEEDDSYEKMAQLIPWCTHLQPPISVLPVEFSRFSHYHDNPRDYGLHLEPPEPFFHTYPLSDAEISRLVYFFEKQDTQRTPLDPAVSLLLWQPGIVALKKQVWLWQQAFWSDERPELSMSITPTELRIRDTRSASGGGSFSIHGIDREVYLACDKAMHLGSLVNRFEQQGVSRSELEQSIGRLQEKRFIIELDKRFLALAVSRPFRELPQWNEWPGGHVDPEKFAVRNEAQSV